MDPLIVPYLRRVIDPESLSQIEPEILEDSLEIPDRVIKMLDSEGLYLKDRELVETTLYRNLRQNRLTKIFHYISENFCHLTIDEACAGVRGLDFSRTPEEKAREREESARYLFSKLMGSKTRAGKILPHS